MFLQICLCPRRQWSCWQVESQYLVLHLTHRGASWASGAAQAAQFVMIIFCLEAVCENGAVSADEHADWRDKGPGTGFRDATMEWARGPY